MRAKENFTTYEELFDKLVDFQTVLEDEGQNSTVVMANKMTKRRLNNNNRQNGERSYSQNNRNNNNRCRNWNNNSRVSCQFCGRPGHNVEICRQLKAYALQ